ncbi:MAG: hypothetical protein Q9166_007078 [cf. Caloplaca sp. 2 TL-2023]
MAILIRVAMITIACVFVLSTLVSTSVIPRGLQLSPRINNVLEIKSTIMAEPNMKPLVKRQDPVPAPQAGEQITIFANGELKDPKYADLAADAFQFTCKLPVGSSSLPPPPSPEPSPGPPPPPPSSPVESVFAIGYFRYQEFGEAPPPSGQTPSKGSVTKSIAAVFAGPDGGDGNPCDATQIYDDKEASSSERPKFPEKLRFNGGGRNNCEYDRTGDDTAGGLTCDGVLAGCTKVNGNPVPFDCKDSSGTITQTWRRQVTCVFRSK